MALSNTFLNILIGLSAGCIGILAFVNDIAKKRPYKILKSFNFKITIFLIATFLGILATIIKDSNSESKIIAERIEAQNQKSKSDSMLYEKQSEIYNLQLSVKDTIIKKVEDAYQKSISASNKALAKYNLQITDSLSKVVRDINIDVFKTQLVMAVSEKGEPPAYFVKKGNKDELNIRFTSLGGTSYDIDLNYLIIGPDNISILEEGEIMYGSYTITEKMTSTHTLEINPEFFKYSKISLWIKGSFSVDPEGLRKVPFNRWLNLDLKDRKFISFGATDFDNLKIIENK